MEGFVVLQLLMTLTYDQRNKINPFKNSRTCGVTAQGIWCSPQEPGPGFGSPESTEKLGSYGSSPQPSTWKVKRGSTGQAGQYCLNWRVPGSTRGCLRKMRRKAMKADAQRQPLTSASPCTHMWQHMGTCIHMHSSYKHIVKAPENMRS